MNVQSERIRIVHHKASSLRAVPGVLIVALMLGLPHLSLAQDAPAGDAPATPVAAPAAAQEDALLTPEELDTLLGPVALFTDNLLAQIFTAATYPLDVVKADRFLSSSGELSDQARANAVAEQDWDDSVKQLAAGFPTVITRMAEHIDWTEQMGEAILAQTDDVLDSVQRLRAVAAENGYLESNAAQVVETVDTTISIAPANPDVVYVPTYEPSVVYTTTAPPVPYYVDNDDDWNDALAAGAIFFGSAIILDEIFDDNDWDGYWGGRGSIDWDNGDFSSRPGIDIGGDVNIDRGDVTIGSDRISNIDRDRLGSIDRDAAGARLGDLDRDALDSQRDKAFRPSAADRDAARAKIETRKARGGEVATLPVGSGDRAGATQNRPKASTRPATARPERALPGETARRPSATQSRPSASKSANISRPTTAKRPTASRPTGGSSAFAKSGGSRAAAAGSRGRASAGGGGGRRR
jgi:hypothetical protein